MQGDFVALVKMYFRRYVQLQQHAECFASLSAHSIAIEAGGSALADFPSEGRMCTKLEGCRCDGYLSQIKLLASHLLLS